LKWHILGIFWQPVLSTDAMMIESSRLRQRLYVCCQWQNSKCIFQGWAGGYAIFFEVAQQKQQQLVSQSKFCYD
jgi:hypothetical protein